jgi:hypothetical protein
LALSLLLSTPLLVSGPGKADFLYNFVINCLVAALKIDNSVKFFPEPTCGGGYRTLIRE